MAKRGLFLLLPLHQHSNRPPKGAAKCILQTWRPMHIQIHIRPLLPRGSSLRGRCMARKRAATRQGLQ